jgi:hypothetical protein
MVMLATCWTATVHAADDAAVTSSVMRERANDPLATRAGFDPARSVAPQASYGAEGTSWWNVSGGAASDFDDIEDVHASVGISAFAARDVEVLGDLLLRYIVQEGNDAVALNPQIAFRWHFYRSSDLAGFCAGTLENTWTAFLEAGIGIMLSSDDVPPPATSLNFTPRAGAGLTYAINDRTRIVTSLRWSHVSNADILGNDDNVGSDGLMLILGVTWAW